MSNTTWPTRGDVIARTVMITEAVRGFKITIDGGVYNVGKGVVRFVEFANGRANSITLNSQGASGLTPIVADGNNYVMINRALLFSQQTTEQKYEDLSEHAVVGIVISQGGSPVGAFNDVNISSVNIPGALYELRRTMRPVKKNGLVLTHSGTADMRLKATAGEALILMNYTIEEGVTNPHLFQMLSDSIYDTYFYLNRTAAGMAITVETEVQPAFWDNGTALVANLPNRWTAQRVYSFGDPAIVVVHYGQEEFMTLEGAVLSVFADPFVKFQALDGATFFGWVLVKTEAVNLGDDTEAIFINPPQVNGETNTTLSF